MLLKRFFERARTRSSICTNKQTCLCTAAKRDSLYDDPDLPLTKHSERRSFEQYGFPHKDKPARLLMRRASMDESDKDDGMSVTERLRRASPESPANIPMLAVISFHPDERGLQKKQIEIQRGFPVNAQYISNEWLFIKTADNEEGFVPYVCCRPILRRQSLRSLNSHTNKNDYSYKLHTFEAGKAEQVQSPSMPITPTTSKKYTLSKSVKSPSHSLQKSSSYRRRQEFTSSSGGGDSGVSDCESSTNNQHCTDLSMKGTTNLSSIQSMHFTSNALKKTGLIVQDLPLKKSSKTNQIKSQLSVSTNSAFTQIVKKSQRHESRFQSNHDEQEPPTTSSSFTNTSHRLYDSYDATKNLSSKYSFDNSDTISSPYIRRTPYARRSLPYHSQTTTKKSISTKLSSSPDPFKTNKEQRLRNIVFAEPSLPLATTIPKQSKLERQFSDLSLNQIENDSLSPPTPIISAYGRPLLSCSLSSASSSTDDSSTPFIHIQMNSQSNGQIPVLYASSNITSTATTHNNSDVQTKKSTSFIHNVSITV